MVYPQPRFTMSLRVAVVPRASHDGLLARDNHRTQAKGAAPLATTDLIKQLKEGLRLRNPLISENANRINRIEISDRRSKPLFSLAF
jgi:hypothetical protein